jgi:hypothetical protein
VILVAGLVTGAIAISTKNNSDEPGYCDVKAAPRSAGVSLGVEMGPGAIGVRGAW